MFYTFLYGNEWVHALLKAFKTQLNKN